jgi:hypothetical protein
MRKFCNFFINKILTKRDKKELLTSETNSNKLYKKTMARQRFEKERIEDDLGGEGSEDECNNVLL